MLALGFFTNTNVTGFGGAAQSQVDGDIAGEIFILKNKHPSLPAFSLSSTSSIITDKALKINVAGISIFTSRINTRGLLRKVFFGGEEGFGPIKGRWEKKASERNPANKL